MSKIAGLKIHVGSGDVYLNDYINCDIGGTLVSSMPSDWVNPNSTSLEKYFKYSFGSAPRQFYNDKQFNALEKWPFEDRSAKEIVTISFIEHFSPQNAAFIMSEVERILKHHGKWIVDFPNIRKTVQQYYSFDLELCMRLIYCNQKNDQSVHRWGYTANSFREILMKRAMWKEVRERQIVVHDYPMTGMIATRNNA